MKKVKKKKQFVNNFKWRFCPIMHYCSKLMVDPGSETAIAYTASDAP